MPPKVAIVGAGIIGAAIARDLARAGAEVTLFEGDRPATQASGRSFGWINASYFANEDHFRLRAAGMVAFHRLTAHHPKMAVRWPGCLWWEEQGDALDQMSDKLENLGYPVEKLTQKTIRTRVPHLASAPEKALFFPAEGAAETGQLTRQLLDVACDAGARLVTGCKVNAITEIGGRVRGVECDLGRMAADFVVVAAGNGSAALMQRQGVLLPMLRRPGALMYTRPVPPVLPHIMVSPELEFRQDPSGRILAPYSASHQADNSEHLASMPATMAEDTITRLRRLLPDIDLIWDSITVAMRPVPGDGLPAVGACGPDGLYLATMHSGITLAALMGELVSREILNGETEPLLAPFRPERFN